MQENGKPIHKVKNESLNALCDLYGSSVNPIKDQLKAVYRKDPRFWARRPLSADMVIFAAADVLCLVPEIYLAMKRYAIINNSYYLDFLLLKQCHNSQSIVVLSPDSIEESLHSAKKYLSKEILKLHYASTYYYINVHYTNPKKTCIVRIL